MRRHKPKTASDLVAHFQKRCLERIGIILSQRVLKDLIANNKLKCLDKQSNAKTIFHLKREQYNGKEMLQYDVILVYDKNRHAFVTTWRYDEWLAKHGYLVSKCLDF